MFTFVSVPGWLPADVQPACGNFYTEWGGVPHLSRVICQTGEHTYTPTHATFKNGSPSVILNRLLPALTPLTHTNSDIHNSTLQTPKSQIISLFGHLLICTFYPNFLVIFPHTINSLTLSHTHTHTHTHTHRCIWALDKSSHTDRQTLTHTDTYRYVYGH